MLVAVTIVAVLLGTMHVSSAITITLLVSVCPATPTALWWKKPSWDWIKVWAAFAMSSLLWFLLYVLSFGPVARLTLAMGWEINLEIPYSPIVYLYHFTPLQGPIDWYVKL